MFSQCETAQRRPSAESFMFAVNMPHWQAQEG